MLVRQVSKFGRVLLGIGVLSAMNLLLVTPAVPQSAQSSDAQKADIVRRQQQEAQVRRAAQELDAANKRLEQLLAEAEAREKGAALNQRTLEQRIASLEAGLRQLQAANQGASANRFDPQNVRAPFVVKDSDGVVLMRIDRSPNNKGPRLTVGESTGSAVVLGAGADGGLLQLVDASNKVRVVVAGFAKRAVVETVGDAGRTILGSLSDGIPVVGVSTRDSKVVGQLQLKDTQTGMLLLGDTSGNNIVVADVNVDGIGRVKVGPAGNGPAALLGNAGRAASAIVGKK